LRVLSENGVRLAIGSDEVNDSSVAEFFYLKELNIFDNLTLLTMLAETTPQSIFPGRRIGTLSEGSEAGFLALEGNSLEDLQNVRKIRVRFKQGFLLEAIRN
jgi:imidazolonepropionase-like amidohydrolase